jgi:hypothetical protein
MTSTSFRGCDVGRYSEVEAKLRKLGFEHDTRQGAPVCRWLLGGVVVDIMPTQGTQLGLNTAWFPEALATATWTEVGPTRLPLISPVAFLATKYVAFRDRGNSDFYGSHDLEDLITVIDGRDNIVAELDSSPSPIREYVAGAVKELNEKPAFNEAVPAHLPGDTASQRRLPSLRIKLAAIAKLPGR